MEFYIYLFQYDDQLIVLEAAVRSSKEAALDALETDSAITSTSFQHDDGMYLESEGSERYGQSRLKVSIHYFIKSNNM